MNQKSKNIIIIILAFIAGMWIMHLFKTYKFEKRSDEIEYSKNSEKQNKTQYNEGKNSTYNSDIEKLTEENTVINYIKTNHQLPDYYITKKEAKKQGWIPAKGNLCDAIPGKAIGGDFFSNRERQLPAGVQYFEADVNFSCGRRTTDRIVFSKDGKVWITHNHYKTFEER